MDIQNDFKEEGLDMVFAQDNQSMSTKGVFSCSYIGNYSAVTGACLAIMKEKYLEVGGFDEKLSIAYNDIDFCFMLLEKGYYNVIRNDVILYHYESVSRGYVNEDIEKLNRLEQERNYLYSKHPKFNKRDPFYNEKLVQNKVNYEIG